MNLSFAQLTSLLLLLLISFTFIGTLHYSNFIGRVSTSEIKTVAISTEKPKITIQEESQYPLLDESTKFPLLHKPIRFGIRHGHRLAHIATRSTPPVTPQKLDQPLFQAVAFDLIPFRQEFTRDAFKSLPQVTIEAEYFNFDDVFGLIHTGWTDDEILAALQRLVDVFAQGNIYIRLRKAEALVRVKLSKLRSMAYWFYVDYPRASQLSPGRLERRELMDSILGTEFVTLLQELDRERQGLFDFISGWPEERTPWENANVVGMYPSFYYQFMNGGGERGCMRFRTGDCNTIRTLNQLDGVQAKCYRFAKKAGEAPVVRSWERYNFTAAMAIRLVAHEFGHSVQLHHAKSQDDCVKVRQWKEANLMHQVLKMAPHGSTCRVMGYPELASQATMLTDEQLVTARENIRTDLRASPKWSKGSVQLGQSIEIPSQSCVVANSVIVFHNAEQRFTVKRIRWKSSTHFQEETMTLTVLDRNKQVVGIQEVVNLHQVGGFVHQEHDVHVKMEPGQYLAMSARGLNPESRVYEDALVLTKDLELKQRDHPTIHELMNSKDQDSLFPEPVAMAKLVKQWVMNGAGEWVESEQCAALVFNMDVEF